MVALLNMPRAAWKRQPRGAVKILPSAIQSLDATLVTALLPSMGHLLNNSAITATGVGVTKYPMSDGVGWFGNGVYREAYMSCANVLSTQSFSALGVVQFSSTMLKVLACSRNTTYTGNTLFVENTRIGFGTFGNNTVWSSNFTSLLNNQAHVLGWIRRSGTSLQYFLDGKSVGSTGAGSDQTIDSVGRIGEANAWGGSFDYKLGLYMDWDGPLSIEQMLEYTRNPWQLFAPAPSRFYLIPSSGGVITLIVQNASHNHAVESPSLTQAHVLVLADSLHGHTVESPLLSQAYALTLAAAAHAHMVDAPDLTQAHSLSVAEASHNHSVDNVSLFQAHILNLSDALHGHSAEAPTLTMAGSLLVADAQHGQPAEAPSLTQAHTITVQEASHGHSVEGLTLTQAYVLVPADTTHGHSSEVPTLSTELNLVVADSLHSHTVEAPGLTQAHVLSLADSLHGHSAEAVSMGQGYSLIVADASHNHSAESPTVSVAFVLAIQDALHSQAADQLALATHITLIVSDALHTHLAGSASEISLPTGDRIFLVAHEDRLFLVATEDRLFGV